MVLPEISIPQLLCNARRCIVVPARDGTGRLVDDINEFPHLHSIPRTQLLAILFHLSCYDLISQTVPLSTRSPAICMHTDLQIWSGLLHVGFLVIMQHKRYIMVPVVAWSCEIMEFHTSSLLIRSGGASRWRGGGT